MIRKPRVLLMVSLMVGAALCAACTAPSPAAVSEPTAAASTPAAATSLPPTVVPTLPPTAVATLAATAIPTALPISEPAPLHLSWMWPAGGPALFVAVAVADDGMLYVADQEGALHAVTAPGEELWSAAGDCGFMLPPVLSSDGSRLYLVGDDEPPLVCALDTAGELVWQTPVEGLAQSVPVLAPDGALHLRTESGIVRISPDGAATAYALPEELISLFGSNSPPVFDGSGNAYFAQDTANTVWVLSPEYEVSATCELEELRSEVVTGSDEGFVVALEPGDIVSYDASCAERWRYAALEDASLALAVGQDGVLYAGGPGGLLVALNENGEELWRNEPQSEAPEIVTLDLGADGTIVAVTTNPPSVLAYSRQGEPLLAQQLYKIDNTGIPVALPGGGVAQVHEGRLEVYTSDPALVVAAPTPAPPPQSAAQAEAEIAQFMLDMIVEEEIEGTLQYVEDLGYGAAPSENLIVWSDVLDPQASEAMTETGSFLEGIPTLDQENPRQVWTYSNGELVEVAGDTAQKLAAIEAYSEAYIDMDTEQAIWAWGSYEFAIVSLDPGLQNAEVYRSASCGPLCGSGFLFTLQRAPDGDWYVSESVHLWQS